MFLKGLVCKDSCRAYLNEVAAEYAFERAVVTPSEIDPVGRTKHIEILSAGIVPVEPYAPVTLDAAVHHMVNIRTEILIIMSPLFKVIAAVVVPGHYSHILQMAFSAFVAHRTVVRMVGHQPFYDG